MKKVLKIKKRHPVGRFLLGRHAVGMVAKEFDLNEAELKELETAGPKAWLEEVKKKEESKPKRGRPAKKKED